jgi:hypothetical protein
MPMNDPSGLPSEERSIDAVHAARFEELHRQWEEEQPKIWEVPLAGALYWARRNKVPTADWIHGLMVRNRGLRHVFHVLCNLAILACGAYLILKVLGYPSGK